MMKTACGLVEVYVKNAGLAASEPEAEEVEDVLNADTAAIDVRTRIGGEPGDQKVENVLNSDGT